jgi:hypothetical protein
MLVNCSPALPEYVQEQGAASGRPEERERILWWEVIMSDVHRHRSRSFKSLRLFIQLRVRQTWDDWSMKLVSSANEGEFASSTPTRRRCQARRSLIWRRLRVTFACSTLEHFCGAFSQPRRRCDALDAAISLAWLCLALL